MFRVDFFRINRFDLLAVKGTLKSLLQHHNSKASILWHSAFFSGPTLKSRLCAEYSEGIWEK